MQKLIAQAAALVKPIPKLPLNALMKHYPTRIFFRTVRYFALLLVFAVYVANPAMVAADFLKVISPAEILVDTPFEVNLEISAQPNTSYFVKARLGNETNQLRFGQTLNETKNIWLSDSVSWQDFPQFSTDSNGAWIGKIHAKSASNAHFGSNYLVIRIHSQAGTNTDSATYSVTLGEEQKLPPTTPKPVVVSTGNPILNEFMPQPQTGSKEWLEIKNKGTAVADLSGWKVDDEAGKSSPQVIATGTVIQPGGFLVVTFDSPKLNDLTDSVRLLKPDDSVVENYTYPNTERGQTWSKDSQGNWFLTNIISPNAENANPPSAVAPQTTNATNKSLTTNKSTTDQAKPSEITETAVGNKLPSVLAAKDKKIATVSASFSIKKSNSGTFLPLIALGSLMILGAGIFLIKKKMKSGQSENSDQPL